MIVQNKFIQSLIKYRITIACIYLGLLLFVGFWAALILGITSDNYELSKTILDFFPNIFFVSALLLLIFYIFTGILKYRLKIGGASFDRDESAALISIEDAMVFGSKKAKILMACWGSFVCFILVASILCILFGLENYLEYFSVFILFGSPIWFAATWKYFSLKIK